jgi:hypothetical protein
MNSVVGNFHCGMTPTTKRTRKGEARSQHAHMWRAGRFNPGSRDHIANMVLSVKR